MSMGIGAANLGITVAASSKASSVGLQVSTVQSKVDSVGVQTSTAVSTAASVGVLTSATVSTAISKVDSVSTRVSTAISTAASVGVQVSTVQSKVDSVGVQVSAIAITPSDASTTATGTIVQDGSTGTPNCVEVAPDPTGNTFGAWTQLDASVSADSYLSNISINTSSASVGASRRCLEIGTGGVGAEVTKFRLSFYWKQADGTYYPPVIFSIPIPIKIASGTRIAARMSNATDINTNFEIGIGMYQTLE